MDLDKIIIIVIFFLLPAVGRWVLKLVQRASEDHSATVRPPRVRRAPKRKPPDWLPWELREEETEVVLPSGPGEFDASGRVAETREAWPPRSDELMQRLAAAVEAARDVERADPPPPVRPAERPRGTQDPGPRPQPAPSTVSTRQREDARSDTARSIRKRLGAPGSLREAFLLREILGPALAQRRAGRDRLRHH